MKKTPDISVIIPVYNAENYLKKCIDSVYNQEKDNIELIIVNDGSTDNSLNIINQYKSNDKIAIKIITQKNQGIIGARITGYKNATGKYIAWLDNDDFIDKLMYKKMYELAELNNADMVICNYKFYPHSIKTKQKWFNNFTGVKDWRFINRNGLLWNKLVNKDLLKKINFSEILSMLGEGSYTIAMLEADKICTIDDELYNYRVGHSSVSGSYKGKTDYYENILLKERKKYELVKDKYGDDFNNYFEYKVLRSVLISLIVSIINNDYKLYKTHKSELKKFKFFDNVKYKEYLKSDFSFTKIFVFKYFILNSYVLSKILIKIYL